MYIIFFKLLKNHQKKTKYFFLLFIVFNIIFSIIKILPSVDQNTVKSDNSNDKLNSPIDLNSIEIKKTKKINNIFIIVLDGMINLERAETEKIIDSENTINQEIKNAGLNYIDNFKSNYSSTYLSMATLLNAYYPVTLSTPIYSNRKEFFPYMMMKTNNNFYQILKKLKINFTWIGNYWGPCLPNIYTECLTSENKVSLYFSKISRMYDDSVFRYFFYFYFNKYPFRDSYSLLSDNEEFYRSYKKTKSDNLTLMHIFKPHPPYDLDKSCNTIKAINDKSYEVRKKYYSYNFNCTLTSALRWSSEFIKKNPKDNNLIIILGDHGWNFNYNNLEFEENDPRYLSNRLNNVFFAHKSPNKCIGLPPPKSHVNVMRYILNCIYDTNLKYLDDQQYITRYETHPDYGKAYPFLD